MGKRRCRRAGTWELTASGMGHSAAVAGVAMPELQMGTLLLQSFAGFFVLIERCISLGISAVVSYVLAAPISRDNAVFILLPQPGIGVYHRYTSSRDFSFIRTMAGCEFAYEVYGYRLLRFY